MTEIQRQALKVMDARNAGAIYDREWLQIEDIRQDELIAKRVIAYEAKWRTKNVENRRIS